MKHHNLDNFEFSQSYLFFYDKLERSYYYLNVIVETAKRGEPVGKLLLFIIICWDSDNNAYFRWSTYVLLAQCNDLSLYANYL